MSKVKIALVGVGGISQVVRIPSLRKNDDVELVALCDIDESKVSMIAKKYKVPKVYFDIQNLIKKEELDGVLISTPNNLHYLHAKMALNAGKHIICEKPLALTPKESKELAVLAKEKGLVTAVNYNLRFYPINQEAKALDGVA